MVETVILTAAEKAALKSSVGAGATKDSRFVGKGDIKAFASKQGWNNMSASEDVDKDGFKCAACGGTGKHRIRVEGNGKTIHVGYNCFRKLVDADVVVRVVGKIEKA